MERDLVVVDHELWRPRLSEPLSLNVNGCLDSHHD